MVEDGCGAWSTARGLDHRRRTLDEGEPSRTSYASQTRTRFPLAPTHSFGRRAVRIGTRREIRRDSPSSTRGRLPGHASNDDGVLAQHHGATETAARSRYALLRNPRHGDPWDPKRHVTSGPTLSLINVPRRDAHISAGRGQGGVLLRISVLGWNGEPSGAIHRRILADTDFRRVTSHRRPPAIEY